MTNVNAGGGETAKDVSGWTVDTLNMYFSQILNERDRRYEERFESQEKAVAKAEIASEKRFDSVNEFRAQLGDQAATFLTRAEYDAQHKALEDKVDALEKAMVNKIDAAAQSLRDAIGRNSESAAALGTRIERAEATRGGLKEGWAYLVGGVGLVGAVIGIVLVLTT